MEKNTYIKKVTFVVIVVVIVYAIMRMHIPAPTVPATEDNVPINTVSYTCDAGKTIVAKYYQGETEPAPAPGQPPVPNGSVSLMLSDGRIMTLTQTLSADGIRYANPDESFVFWSKGNGALVLENNEEKSYIGCIEVAPEPTGSNLSKIYSNGQLGFSLRYPEGYTIDESYKYEALGPDKDIYGTKFTIPASMAAGTNLGSDSYISVEEIPAAQECSAALFVAPGTPIKSVTENDTTYSVAMANDAAAGNRYDETVYALPGTNPCIAVRYFIHYSVFENYPPGTVKEFDEQALLGEFDQIRHTLIINQ